MTSRARLPWGALIVVLVAVLLAPLHAHAQTDTHAWSTRDGGTGYDIWASVTSDASGAIYAAGTSTSTAIDLGAGPLTTLGSGDLIMARYDADGTVDWSRRIGGTDFEEGSAATTDTDGNVLVGGYSRSPTIDLGTGPLAGMGSEDFIFAKYASSGAPLWTRRVGGPWTELLKSLASDPTGDVLIAGWTNSPSIDLGGGSVATAGQQDVVLARYDGSDGTHLWSKVMGGTGWDEASSVAVDAEGNIIIAGFSTSPTIDLGGGPLPGLGNADLIMAAYAPDGSHLWSKRLGSSGVETATAVAIDPANNVLLAGIVDTTVDLGGGALPAMGSKDIFLASFDGAGTHRWSRRLGGAQFDQPGSIAGDHAGNVLITGYTGSPTVDLGGGALPSSGGDDIFVGRYAATDGSHLWSARLGGTSHDRGWAIASSPGGLVLAGETFSGTIDLGGGPLTASASGDMVLARYTYDVTPPASAIDDGLPITSNVAGVRLTGTATDDSSGVEGVAVTYVAHVTNATVVVDATLTCDAARLACTYEADGPGLPGVWDASARARDRNGNVEAAGPTTTIVALP